jgi:flagellar secretion chaperone FliS
MNPYQAYKRQRESVGRTRIDSVLALYDGAIERLTTALKLLKAKDRNKAMSYLCNSQLIIMGLATVAPVDRNKELGENLLRLYDFCARCIEKAEVVAVEDAIKILQIIRKGYEAVRPEVAEMERTGKLRPAGSLHMIRGIA